MQAGTHGCCYLHVQAPVSMSREDKARPLHAQFVTQFLWKDIWAHVLAGICSLLARPSIRTMEGQNCREHFRMQTLQSWQSQLLKTLDLSSACHRAPCHWKVWATENTDACVEKGHATKIPFLMPVLQRSPNCYELPKEGKGWYREIEPISEGILTV